MIEKDERQNDEPKSTTIYPGTQWYDETEVTVFANWVQTGRFFEK